MRASPITSPIQARLHEEAKRTTHEHIRHSSPVPYLGGACIRTDRARRRRPGERSGVGVTGGAPQGPFALTIASRSVSPFSQGPRVAGSTTSLRRRIGLAGALPGCGGGVGFRRREGGWGPEASRGLVGPEGRRDENESSRALSKKFHLRVFLSRSGPFTFDPTV